MELESQTAIVLKDVSIRRGERSVLKLASCEIQSGEVLAVVGSSGVGKSTLLGVLCGLLRPESGEIRILDQDRSMDSDQVWSKLRLKSFGLVFQTDELLTELTILENLTLPLRLGARPERTEHYRSLANQVLARLGIADLADRRVHEVSGGQLQRAAVARAVIHRPQIILADEPTDNLDRAMATATLQLLIELAREQRSTVIIVTHDQSVAESCDRAVEVIEGAIVGRSIDSRSLA